MLMAPYKQQDKSPYKQQDKSLLVAPYVTAQMLTFLSSRYN